MNFSSELRTLFNGILSGWLVGFAVLLIFAFSATNPANAQLTELFAFQFDTASSDFPDGQQPMSELIEGADGNYYAITAFGGAGGCPGLIGGETMGCGAVVRITPMGAFSVVYSFPYDAANQTAPNGVDALGGLVQGPDRNFYGITGWGGTVQNCPMPFMNGAGCGTVIKLTPAGKLIVLHSFCGIEGCGGLNVDGWLPMGRLIFGSDGNLYGTTNQGGLVANRYNSGTIFKISRNGTYKILHMFSGNSGTGDGANPTAGLIQASDGNFYGTTQAGGTHGSGTVFRMTPSGVVTVIHSFSPSDGEYPQSALFEARDGNLYATCYGGGANSVGTAFRISKSGSFQKLYDFTNAPGNLGYAPKAGLVQGPDGDLYGTTWAGGNNFGSTGTLYKLTTSGTVTLLANFDPNSNGSVPVAVPLLGSDGNLYLTASQSGGLNPHGYDDQGAIDRLTTSFAPPRPAIGSFYPTKGTPGVNVTIAGSAFVGATAVKFNGISATFTVEASGFIVAKVPVGATTGTITVKTRGGTATSRKTFTVL